MSRIRKAYETRFCWLLQRARARKISQGVAWLVDKAASLSRREHISFSAALMRVHDDLAGRPRFRKPPPAAPPEVFFCDAGRGGLARWLRAAGYEALWEEGIDDSLLLAKARKLAATVITTDSMLMERRLLRDRIIPAFWMPPTLSLVEQLTLVMREFRLPLRERRCMRCGGPLLNADKQTFKDRIPPRTYRWLEEYFICSRCGQLFWQGTHWNRIRRQLESAAGEHGQGIKGPKGV